MIDVTRFKRDAATLFFRSITPYAIRHNARRFCFFQEPPSRGLFYLDNFWPSLLQFVKFALDGRRVESSLLLEAPNFSPRLLEIVRHYPERSSVSGIRVISPLTFARLLYLLHGCLISQIPS